ncbi:MAG: hypothetical protein JSR33_09810 [Proteobacteria bacterium]|nr:hypothetical protein [Pseudomonadota bacterium]
MDFYRLKDQIKYLLPISCVLLSGCVYGPIYPWSPCAASGPCQPGGFPIPCTQYHPNRFYRCHNSHCVTYSPYAPNRCDPYPYYTPCKYTSCGGVPPRIGPAPACPLPPGGVRCGVPPCGAPVPCGGPLPPPPYVLYDNYYF